MTAIPPSSRNVHPVCQQRNERCARITFSSTRRSRRNGIASIRIAVMGTAIGRSGRKAKGYKNDGTARVFPVPTLATGRHGIPGRLEGRWSLLLWLGPNDGTGRTGCPSEGRHFQQVKSMRRKRRRLRDRGLLRLIRSSLVLVPIRVECQACSVPAGLWSRRTWKSLVWLCRVEPQNLINQWRSRRGCPILTATARRLRHAQAWL